MPLASGRNLLAELKSDPGKVSLETLLREVDKLAADFVTRHAAVGDGTTEPHGATGWRLT
ncbi:hypothetical protein [Nocardia sp. NPDC050793]|uniref:hypothetical protein n=1 Tax=Nocardia sp. NPDC050793 TaxID=3155159 RepID=UPI0033E05064